MIGTIPDEASIDPERYFDERAGGDRTDDGSHVDTAERTCTHESADHCEADAAGRSIVGVTGADGRVLLWVHPEEEHAILSNDTVAPDENWRTVGREWVRGSAGLGVEIDGIERVRRITHVVEGEEPSRSVTYHVVFAASVVPTEAEGTIPDGLCADNPWELGWYDELPFEIEDEGGSLDDIRLFID